MNDNNYSNNYNSLKEVYNNNLRNYDLNNVNFGKNIPITPRYSSDLLQYQQQANLNYLSKTPNVNNLNRLNNNLQISNPINDKPIQRLYNNNSFYSGVQSKNPQFVFSSEGGKREGTDVTNNAYFDHYYNNTYGSYKEINKQYEDYNKSLVAQNEKFKEEKKKKKTRRED